MDDPVEDSHEGNFTDGSDVDDIPYAADNTTTSQQGTNTSASTALTSSTNSTTQWTLYDGDQGFDPITPDLERQIDLNCQMYSTAKLVCARRNEYAKNWPASRSNPSIPSSQKNPYRYNTNDAGMLYVFVIAGTTVQLPSACYVRGKQMIIVVQQDPNSDHRPLLNNGEPLIVFPSRPLLWNGTRMVYHIFKPLLAKNGYNEDSACVEKISTANLVKERKDIAETASTTTTATSRLSAIKAGSRSARKLQVDNSLGMNSSGHQSKKVKRESSSEDTLSQEPDNQLITQVPSTRRSTRNALLVAPVSSPAPRSLGKKPRSTSRQSKSLPGVPLRNAITSSSIHQSQTPATQSRPLPVVSTYQNTTSGSVYQDQTSATMSEMRSATPTPTPTSKLSQQPTTNDTEIYFVFENSSSDEPYLRVPASKIDKNSKLFNYALCTKVVKPTEDVLQLEFNNDITYVMRDDEYFFNNVLQEIEAMDGDEFDGDVIVTNVRAA